MITVDNKPSCRQSQFQTFRSSNLCHFLALWSNCLLHVLTCSELFLDVSRATADPCFWEKPVFFFHLENYGYSFKCLIGWQRDDHDCVEEIYNPIKLNEFTCWLFSGGGGVHNLHCVELNAKLSNSRAWEWLPVWIVSK